MAYPGTTSVDVQGMVTAQGYFQTALEQCNTAYGNMTEQQSTLAGNWSGEAASTFGVALTNYLEDFSSVISALSAMLETLSQNTGVYANTNEGSSQMAGAFLNGVPG